MASILVMGAASATAQTTTHSQRTAFGIARSMAKNTVKKHFMAVRKAADASQDAQAVTYLPAKQTEYTYEDEWAETGTYANTYDNDGRITRTDYDSDGTITRTDNTWTHTGMLTDELVTTSEDGGETFVNSSRRVQIYDDVVPSLIISKDKYYWDDIRNTWVRGDAFRRDITRDADNNITKLVLSTPYDGEFDPTMRFFSTIDPQTKQVTTFSYEELKNNDDYTGFVWEEQEHLTNMKWKQTNGQLFDSHDTWYSGGNYLLSADIEELMDDGTYAKVGYISCTYTADGGFVYTTEYTDDMEKQVVTLTFDDANGSYTQTIKEYADLDGDGKYTADELMTHNVLDVDFDEYGNQTLEAYYEMPYDDGGDEDGDDGDGSYAKPTAGDDGDLVVTPELELSAATRYEYAYDPSHGNAIKEMTMSEFDYDAKVYNPTMRLVTTDYAAVATAISSVSADGSQPQAIYDIQGMRLGSKATEGRHGIVIVKKDGKATKVLK